MSVSLDRGTTIGRLRLVAATADPNALRMRGGSVLGALDLQPPAMPEQAILCIRKLHDPLPGGLDLRSSAAPRPAAWEAAMRDAVAGFFHRAVRPALGAVPANAEAVVFADRAELLACAARDAQRGTLASHWWWTHLLGGERSVAAVVREWTRSPAYVPAAAEVLAARGEIAAFARCVSSAEAVRLVEAVLRAHALPVLAFDVVTALTSSFTPPAAILREPQPAVPKVATLPGEIPGAPPWHAIVPELAAAALTVEQQSFVAIALVLRRAPALARSERFEREAAAWIESARQGERYRDAPMSPRTVEPPTAGAELQGAARTVESHEATSENGIREDIAPKPHPPTPSPVSLSPAPGREGATTQKKEIQGHGGSPSPGGGWAGDGRGGQGVRFRSDAAPGFDTPLETAPPPPEISANPTDLDITDPPPRPDLAIDSDFAGIFFLLNVGIALGLYSDFTSPVQRGISLDVWDFLALTGGALVESADFEDDPIGPLFATLANRKDGERPGAGFVPPDGQSPREWLDMTVSRIRDRLALAGLDEAARIVRRYGRVTTTPAHLDVYFSLAAHPIEIRLAGLDRNPGWIPAAGRHVAFHFD